MAQRKFGDLSDELGEELIPPESTGGDDVEVPEEVESWVDETKGVERIISVAITTSKPRTADWIAGQALVAEQTARDHLQTFAELGVIASFTSSGVTRYHADEAFIHYREVSRFVEQYSKQELSEKADSVRSRLDSIKGEYDHDSPDSLRAAAATEDLEVSTIRDFKKTAADWESLRDKLAVLEDAIRRFEKFDHPASAQV